MKKRRSLWSRITALLLKVLGLLFPSLNELQVAMLGVCVAAVIFFQPNDVSAAGGSDRSPLIVMVIIASICFLMMKQKFILSTKALISTLYYMFFTIMAVNAINNLMSLPAASSIDVINYVLMFVILALAIARGLVSTVLARINSPLTNRLVAQNFRDTQYRPIAYIIAGFATLISVSITYVFYPDTVTCIVLSLTYANMFMALVEAILPARTLAYSE